MTSEAEIGEVAELWRYPVGSVGGETVELLKVNADQVVGDRIFRVVRLGSLKAIFGAHVYGFASLLDARAVLDESRNDMTVTVVLPDGDACRADDPEAGEWLSRYLGRPVQLLPTKASWAKESSMIAVPALPVAPMHIVSTAALAELASLLPESAITSTRFRANVVIRTHAASGFIERSWVGRRLRIGAATVAITENVRRCPMTSLAQPGLPRDPDIYRVIQQATAKEFGVYATPLSATSIRKGDTVALLS